METLRRRACLLYVIYCSHNTDIISSTCVVCQMGAEILAGSVLVLSLGDTHVLARQGISQLHVLEINIDCGYVCPIWPEGGV